MKNKIIRGKQLIFLLVFLLFFSFATQVMAAVDLPGKPTHDVYVQDYAEILTPETESFILKTAKALDDRTTAQVAVVTIDTLNGNSIEEYANQLFRTWGIGNKEKNNGILLLIANQDHKFRIEVGYGLEGRIPDGKAGDIIREMTPLFKESKYDKGVMLGFSRLATEVAAEYEVDLNDVGIVPVPETQADSLPLWAVVLIVISILVLLMFLGIFLGESPFWFFILLSDCIANEDSDSGGGFGGGSSGGGGASGGW